LIVRFQKLSNYGKYFCEIDRVHHGIYVVRIIKTVPEKDKEQFEAVTSAVMEALVHSNSIRIEVWIFWFALFSPMCMVTFTDVFVSECGREAFFILRKCFG